MQTSYQEYSTLGKSRPLVLNSPATNDVRNTYLQPTLSSEVNQTEKISGENSDSDEIAKEKPLRAKRMVFRKPSG